MRVGIVGSRDYNFWDLVLEFVDRLPTDTTVISGGAIGVDTLAEHRAKQRKLAKIIHRADWDKHGRSAGFVRNRDIITDSEWVVAFWNGISKGTAYTIKLTAEAGKPLTVVSNPGYIRHFNGAEALWSSLPTPPMG